MQPQIMGPHQRYQQLASSEHFRNSFCSYYYLNEDSVIYSKRKELMGKWVR